MMTAERCRLGRNSEELTEDCITAAQTLKSHSLSTGKIGAVGFCFSGGMVNELAVRIPDIIAAAVPFYGRQPSSADVPKIKAAMLIHFGSAEL